MKLALITGGSKGLGLALVNLYKETGWVVKEFSRSGTTEDHIDCDFADSVTSTSVLSNTFQELSTRNWSEVVLINNVGTLNPIGPIQLDEPSDWQTNIQINLNSCITSAGLFLKSFNNPNTNRFIVNISSGAATNPFYGWSLYCASKAAIEAFTKCVAIEQSRSDNPVLAIIIIPGVFDTDMQETIRSQNKDRFEDLDRFKKLKSEGSLQPPEKVAKAILSIIGSSPQGGESYDVRDYF